MTRTPADTVAALLSTYDHTYAQDAGITLRDAPAPLYQLLVLANLLSARISAGVAVASARELFEAGCCTPEAVHAAPRRQLVAALGRGGYARYDERTTTMLRDGAELLLDAYDGDLRKLRDASPGPRKVSARLREFPGIGPTGASIFAREVQGVWPVLAPSLDRKALDGARRLGLPTDVSALAELVAPEQLPLFASALVRVALHRGPDDPLA